MKLALFAATAALCLVQAALGNGGGYTRGGVTESGAIKGFEPRGTERVRILDEVLRITLGRESASFIVRYVLKEVRGQKADVRFGFPFEEIPTVDELNEDGSESATRRPKPSEPKALRHYKVSVSGKEVSHRFAAEPQKSSATDERFQGLKGWMVSTISFSPGEEKTMEISYRADYAYTEVSVSDDERNDARRTVYRLSTGAVWDGPIERGRVEIKTADGIDPAGVKVLKPVNRFERQKDAWVWTFENLEPTLQDDLEIQAVPAETVFGARYLTAQEPREEDRPVDFIERDQKWFVRHANYSIQASSTLPPQADKIYDAANVRSWDAPWVEGAKGPGIGEWLRLEPEVAKPLSAVCILPGYLESERLYRANARPRKVEITLNGEFRFEAELEDRPDMQRIPVLGYDQPVKQVQITIKDVYRGAKYEDLCINGIRLESRLDKKPKVQPAR